MSDICHASADGASQNFVVVAQTARSNRYLTKTNYADKSQRSYDNVKYYNFYEKEIWSLDDLYMLVKRLINQPRCCLIRARIKDQSKTKNVVRQYKSDDATLILDKQNWFAIDIDSDEPATGNLIADFNTIQLELPECFHDVECFIVASASYMFKPGIRMRLFYWAEQACHNTDLKRLLKSNEAGADIALYNPIQPIYTAAPLGINPVKDRIKWYRSHYNITVNIPVAMENYRGAPEMEYTKESAERIVEAKLKEISLLTSGERHDKLFNICILFGKLIAQDLIEEEATIFFALSACNDWIGGKRNKRKDLQTIKDGIEWGKRSITGMRQEQY